MESSGSDLLGEKGKRKGKRKKKKKKTEGNEW